MCSERPIYISATGPDGAGKDSAWRFAKPLLPPELKIVKIGKPSSVITNGEEKFVDMIASKTLDQIHSWADSKKSKLLTSCANMLFVMFQWKVQEPYWTMKIHPDLVFSLRDGYSDPAAYAPFYMPKTLGKLPVPNRITFLHNLHRSPFREQTLFLDIEPKMAMERIRGRMQRESEMPDQPLRPKWLHQHENLEDLTLIRLEFLKVLDYLKETKGTSITVIDTTYKTRDTIGQKMASFITNGLSHRSHESTEQISSNISSPT